MEENDLPPAYRVPTSSSANKKAVNRRRFLRGVGASGVIALAGCSGGDGGDGGDGDTGAGGDGGDGGDTATETSTEPEGGVTVDDDEADIVLQGRTLFTGGDGEAFENIVRDYNDEHDNVSIEIQRIPWDEYYDQMFTTMTGGDPPDLGIFHYDQLLQFSEVLEPLDDVDLSPYADAALDGRLEVDGTVYGLPMDFLAQAMYYNKEIFEEAGLDPENPPDSDWQEFKDACDAIVDAGYEGAAFDPGGGGFGRDLWNSYVYQRGAQIIREAGDSWEAAFNNDAGLGATTPFRDMVHEWNWTEEESDPAWEDFVQGRHAIIHDGTWAYSRFREGGGEELDFDWGVFKPLQAPGKEEDHAASSTHTLAVPKNPKRDDEKTQAAIDAIKWITTHTERWAIEGGHMPAAKEVAQSDAVRESNAWDKTLNVFFEMAENDTYFTVPATEADDEYNQVIDQNFDAVRFGEKEPQKALDDAEEGVNQAFQR